MRRGPSPIKRKILSQFFNKFSNKKQQSQFVDSSHQKPPQVIKRKSVSISSIRNPKYNKSQFSQPQKLHKSLQQTINDISLPKQRISTQNFMQENNKNLQKQKQQDQQKELQINYGLKEKQVSLQVSQESINVNTSTSFLQNQMKTIETLKTSNQLHLKEKQDLQLTLKEKQQQIQSILKEKSVSMSKVYKLQQDLLRKERQLARKVNQFNIVSSEKQTFLNFLNNFSDQIEQFMTLKQDIVEDKPKPQKKLSSGKKQQSKSLGAQKYGLKSISQDKEISFLQKINLKSFDNLTKSIQRGLNQTDLSKNTKKLINTFKQFIEQIQKSQYSLINNLKQQNFRLQKQFENQKIFNDKIQREYESEKNRLQKIRQKQNQLQNQLKQIKSTHEKCDKQKQKSKKQVQSLQKKVQKVKEQILKKDDEIKQLIQKIKQFQQKITQQNKLRFIQKRKYEDQINKKSKQIFQLKQKQQQQIKDKAIQILQMKRQLQKMQKRIKQYQSAQRQRKQTINRLKQQLLQKQLQLQTQNKQFSQVKKSIQYNKHQKQQLGLKLNDKQTQINKINIELSKRDKKIFQIDFINSQLKKDLTNLRNNLKNINLDLTLSNKKYNDLEFKCQQFQKLNITLNQQIERWKSKSQKTQKQLQQNMLTFKSNIISSQKQTYRLKYHIQTLQQQKKNILQTNNNLEQVIQQIQIKLKISETTSQSQNYQSLEKDQITKRLTQHHQNKITQIIQQKDKALLNQKKLYQDKITSINELYWRQKSQNFNLKLENQQLKSVNQKNTQLINFLNKGTEIINNNLLQIINQTKINTTTKNNSNKASKSQVQQILSLKQPQFFYSMIQMKLQSKILIEIFSNLFQIKKQLKNKQNVQKCYQSLKQEIKQMKNFVQKQINELENYLQKSSQYDEQVQMSSDIVQQTSIEYLLKCFDLFNSSKIIKDVGINQVISAFQTNSNIINKKKSIDQLILDRRILEINNDEVSSLMNSLNKFMNTLNTIFTKTKLYFIRHKQKIQNKHQNQKQLMKDKIIEINERNQKFTKLLTDLQSNYIQLDSKRIQSMLKLLIQTLQNQLIEKQQVINILNTKISQLQHQLTISKQRQTKFFKQNQSIKRQMLTQQQLKTKIQNQLNTLKQQIYRLKQYQTKRLQQKCNQLQIQLQHKNNQLSQAYLFLQKHIKSNQFIKEINT